MTIVVRSDRQAMFGTINVSSVDAVGHAVSRYDDQVCRPVILTADVGDGYFGNWD